MEEMNSGSKYHELCNESSMKTSDVNVALYSSNAGNKDTQFNEAMN